ncbi:MAG: helix-turn-helix domain-containing protein [Nanoarchaeota archaeon]
MQRYEWTKYKTDYGKYTCPIHKTALLIGDRWTLFILREFIYNGEQQGFNQLLRALKPISSRTLSLKLKRLEASKLVERKVVQERPIQVQYSITRKGKALKKALDSMGRWYKTHHP